MTKIPERTRPPLVLTPEGKIWVWVTVLLIAMGWYKTINLVLLLAYLMFALMLINGFLAPRNARRLVARRDAMLPVLAGAETTIRITVTNTGTRSATASIEDRAGDHSLIWLVHQLPGKESTTCSAHRLFPRRGRFATQIQVWSGFPFGLLKYGRAGESGSDLVVLPAAGLVDLDGMRRWLHQAGGDGRARKLLRRVTTDQAEVRGVRPFRPGDAIRAVHWRSTARRRELMVREYDVAPTLDLMVVVEPWLPPDPTPQQREQLEAALSLAVTIVQTWSKVYGTTVVVAVAGRLGAVRTAAPNVAGVRTALEPLADIKGSTTFQPFAPQAFGRSLSRAVRVLVSSRSASPYADALANSTGRAFIAISPSDGLAWYQSPAMPSPRPDV